MTIQGRTESIPRTRRRSRALLTPALLCLVGVTAWYLAYPLNLRRDLQPHEWIYAAVLVGVPLLIGGLLRTRLGRAALVRIVRRVPNLFACLCGLGFVAYSLVAMEATCGILNGFKSPANLRAVHSVQPPLTRYDQDLGKALVPDVESRWIMTVDGRTEYDVVYHTDPSGRRVTPVDSPEGRDRFVLFFGCSFVFGEGVEDTETLPYHTGCLAPRYKPYNFGSPGWGTQHMLTLIDRKRVLETIPEKEGVAVYVFIDDHVPRVIGDSRIRIGWGHTFPCYMLRNGKLTLEGSFESAQPFTTWLYRVFTKSSTAQYLHAELPPIRDSHVELTARIIAESAKRFREAYPQSPFYVLLYSGAAANLGSALAQHLDELGIPCLNFRWLRAPGPVDEYWHVDGHPKGPMHAYVAAHLVDTLQLNGDDLPSLDSLPDAP